MFRYLLTVSHKICIYFLKICHGKQECLETTNYSLENKLVLGSKDLGFMYLEF